MPQAVPVVAAWAAKTFTVKAVGSFLLKTAATFALNSVATALTRKRAGAQERQAQVSTLSMGEVPREAVFGITAIGGSLVDVFNHGGAHNTDRVTFCIALADHACDGMQGYFVNDEYYPWTGNGPQAAFGGKLILEFRNATEDGHAPPADAVTHGGWTATDRGCGVTHMWVTVVYDEKAWPQGLPRFRWEVRGLHPFDPRRHDHDPDDPTTWTFSRNPILERYSWARGIYATGRHGQPEHLLIGRGLTADEAPPARIIGAANICDEPIDGLLRYFCDGAISADLDFIEVEEMFATSVAGTIVQREGGVEIEPGHAKATVVTITDDDLVVGEPVEYSAFRPDSDGGRVNTVIPRYVSVAQRYTDHSGPVRRDLADIARDGGPREMTLVLPLVSDRAMADRNAEIARRLARLEGRGGITLPPEFTRLEEGDWIAWTSARKFGGATKRFRIEAFGIDAAWRNRLNLREIAASVYGEPDPLDDPVPPPPPPTPPDALSVSGFELEAVLIPGDEAGVVPALRFKWDAVQDPAVRAIRCEVRRQGSEAITPTTAYQVDGGGLVTTNGVAPRARMQGRLVPMGEPSRPVAPTEWKTVSTSGLTADELDPNAWALRPLKRAADFLPRMQQRLDETAARLLGEAAEMLHDEEDGRVASVQRDTFITDEARAETITRTLQVSALGEAVAAAEIYTQTVADDLLAYSLTTTANLAQLGDDLALVDGRTLALVDDVQALASDVVTLESDFGDFETFASTEITALSTAQSSQGSALTVLVGRVGDVEAGNLLLQTAVADLDSALSTLDITLSAEVGDLSAEVMVFGTALTTVEGQVDAIFGFALDVNDRVVGMRAANDGTVGTLDFWFDAVRFWDGTSNTPLLSLSGGRVVIGGALVITSSIEDFAVTDGVAAFTSGSGSMSGTSSVTVQTVSITTTGGEVQVDGRFHLTAWHPGAGDFTAYMSVRRNGSTIWSASIPAINGDRLQGWQTPGIVDAPAAGTHTYTMVASLSRNDGFSIQEVSAAFLGVREYKK